MKCRFRVRNRLITNTQCIGLGATQTLLSQIPCMRFKAAEATKIARFYLEENVRKAIAAQHRKPSNYYMKALSDATDQSTDRSTRIEVMATDHHRKQPLNSAAAISLTVDPVKDRVRTKTLLPRSLAGPKDTNMPRGPGRVPSTPDARNTIKVCERVVGLDGYKLTDRIFSSALERRRHSQRQRRQRQREQVPFMHNNNSYITCKYMIL